MFNIRISEDEESLITTGCQNWARLLILDHEEQAILRGVTGSAWVRRAIRNQARRDATRLAKLEERLAKLQECGG